MTIEEKAKAYDEALKLARESWLNNQEPGYKHYREFLESMFPDLRESEDERVRKDLMVEIQSWEGIPESKRRSYLAYLEKQKEQKPAEWSEEDIKKIRSEEYTQGFNDAAFGGNLKEWNTEDEDRIRQIERIAQAAGCTQKLQEEIHDWLKSLRPQPKQEWSDGEITHLYTLASFIKSSGYEDDGEFLEGIANELKSLRPSWKPSEDEMAALKEASASWMNEKMGNAELLKSLYDGLKKNAL